MTIKTEETVRGDGLAFGDELSDAERRERTSHALWSTAGTLWQRRRLILGITTAAAIASVVIALLLPKWYAAEARVLRSEGGMSLTGVLSQATGGLSSLLGGGGGDYIRYMAILTSRTMMEAVVDEFDLAEVYGIEAEDGQDPTGLAVEMLAANVGFDVDVKFDYLGVLAYDQDPERAAAMANFMVAELNEANARLSSQSARESRLFIEERLRQAEADLDSVRADLQAFQEENGVVELESQAQAFMTAMAASKTRVAEAEVRYQTLAQQYGPDNARVQAARAAAQAARRQVSGALGGRDELLPIALQDLPATTRRYAELMQNQLIQAQIIQSIYPLYEQALFQERSEASAVQVVDAAVPPRMAARPSRRMIVIGTVMSAFLLACVFVLAHGWLKRNRTHLARRLHEASHQAV